MIEGKEYVTDGQVEFGYDFFFTFEFRMLSGNNELLQNKLAFNVN